MREVTRTEPTIVMVNRTWSKPQLKYVLEHVQRRAVRMVIEKDCSCCYPECTCAPSMISPTETEIIITSEECEVPQDYIETITREVPVLTYTNMTIMEP